MSFRICGAGTAEWDFVLGQHLQQCSAPQLPQQFFPESQAVHINDAMAICCSSWFMNPAHFQGPRRKRLGRKMQIYPQATKIRPISFTSKVSFSLKAYTCIHTVCDCKAAPPDYCCVAGKLPWSPLNESRQKDSLFHHRAFLSLKVSVFVQCCYREGEWGPDGSFAICGDENTLQRGHQHSLSCNGASDHTVLPCLTDA